MEYILQADDSRLEGQPMIFRPLVSVIIPAYNCDKTLAEAIDSVLQQSYDNTEIIVVDDGSTDETLKIALRYETGVRVFSQENSGPSRARNRGIHESTGELIAFLDSDDVWLPDKLQQQIILFAGKEKLGIIGSGSYSCDENLDIISKTDRNTCGTNLIRKIMPIRNIFPTPTVIVKRECFEHIGTFNESYKFAEDWDMWIRIIQAYESYYIEQPLIKIRNREGSLSRLNLESMFTVWEEIINKYCHTSIQKRKARSWLYINKFYDYQNGRNWWNSLYFLVSSLREWPFDRFIRYASLFIFLWKSIFTSTEAPPREN